MAERSVFETVLGNRFLELPAPLRELHAPGSKFTASGTARVDGTEGWIARLAAVVFGFPRAAEQVAVTVRIESGAGWERWTRDFSGKRFSSVVSASSVPGRLVERFGVFSFELSLIVGASGVLGMPVLGWRLGPLPMPGWLAPVSVAAEEADTEGRFRFDV